MSKKYTVVVKAILDKVDLQTQMDTVSTEIHQKNTKAVTGQSASVEKLENQVIRWQNELKKTELRYPQAFNTQPVQDLTKEFTGLFDKYKAGGISTDDMRTKLHSLNTEMVHQQQVMKEGSERVGTLGNQFGIAAKKVAIWAVATTAIYGTLRAIQQATEYIKDLDKAMTNIRLVTQSTKEETYELAQSYNQLASELGATTLEVAQGATDWLRQGESIENTQKLLRSTIMLAKLGNTTTAEATEYLISTLNGFQLEAEDSIGLIDKMINLDNLYATSVSEIAAALQKSSASAKQAGVTFDELASYITIVSSVTRQSAESIGVSFRTMFARMQRVKMGAEFDEMGESVSNVETVLSGVGIQLRDTANSFRPLGDVLDEVAARWDTFGETQQNQIAEQIAGIRQRENFLVLMQNYNKVLEAQEHASQSAGIAIERYAIYLEGVEAAANKAKAAWEGMWQATINSDGIKFLYNLSAAVANLITRVGGLIPILITVVGILVAIKATQVELLFVSASKAVLAFGSALVSAATGAQSLSVALAGLSATSIVGILIAVAGVTYMVVKSFDNLDERIEKLTDSIETLQSEITQLGSNLQILPKLYEEIESLQELEKTTGLTVDQQERLRDVQNELVKILPEASGYYDEQGNFIADLSVALETYNDLLEEEIRLRREKLLLDAEERIDDQVKKYENLANKMEILNAAREEALKWPEDAKGSQPYGELGSLDTIMSDIAGTSLEINQITKDIISHYMMLDTEGRSALISLLKTHGGVFDEIITKIRELDGEIKGLYGEGEEPTRGLSTAVTDYFATIDEKAGGAVERLSVLNDSVSSIVSGFLEAGKLTADQVSKIQELFPETFNQVLENTSDGIVLNTEALKELVDREVAAARSAVEVASATGELTNEMRAQILVTEALAYELGEVSYSTDGFAYAQENAADAMEDFARSNSVAARALEEYGEHGQISIQTALNLIDAGYAQAVMFDQNTGAISINIYMLRELQIAEIDVAIATQNEALATAIAEGRNYSIINSIKARIRAQEALRDVLNETVGASADLSGIGGGGYSFTPVSGGGGGGGGGKSPEAIAIEEEIKSIERKIKSLDKQKDAYKDLIKDYKRYIDNKKEELKLLKEEKDFGDSIMKKNKQLAKMKAEITLLALDDSQEARAKRLELEEEAAGLEEEITEDKEDRKYDLQIGALNRLQQEYEDNIQRQIDLIDDTIDRHRDQIDILREEKEAYNSVGGAVGSVRGAVSGLTDDFERLNQKIVGTIVSIAAMSAAASAGALARLAAGIGGGGGSGGREGTRRLMYHEGGIVDKDFSKKTFDSPLKPNEVYAKLLEGEYVSSETQMDRFVRKTLPAIVSRASAFSDSQKMSTIGDINFDIDISVDGSLDKSVVPDLKNAVLGEVNKALKQSGITRNATKFST